MSPIEGKQSDWNLHHFSWFFWTDAMKHKRLRSLTRRCGETMTLLQQHPVKTRTCSESGSESGQNPPLCNEAGCRTLCTHSHCDQLSRPPHHPGLTSPPPPPGLLNLLLVFRFGFWGDFCLQGHLGSPPLSPSVQRRHVAPPSAPLGRGWWWKWRSTANNNRKALFDLELCENITISMPEQNCICVPDRREWISIKSLFRATKRDSIGFPSLQMWFPSCCSASPVVSGHADALSSRDELLHFGHAVALPRDLAREQNSGVQRIAWCTATDLSNPPTCIIQIHLLLLVSGTVGWMLMWVIVLCGHVAGSQVADFTGKL